MSQFERAAPLLWQVGGRDYHLSAGDINETGDKRLGRHRRLYRNGARIDIIGTNEREIRAQLAFHDNCEDPAVLAQTESGRPLRSVVLREFLDSWFLPETGTLHVPSVGIIRAVFANYRKVETNEDRDFTAVEATWVEDSEDDSSPEQFQRATIRSSKVLVDRLKAGMDSEGWGDLGGELSKIANLLAAPLPEQVVGEYLVNLGRDAQAGVEAIYQAFVDRFAAKEGNGAPTARDLFDRPSPDKHMHIRRISLLRDRVAATIAEGLRGRPQFIPRVFATDRSMFQIATETGTRLEDLLAANPGVDPFRVPAGTAVLAIR